MNQDKFAFIMRGVPGSGKSSTALYLAGDSGIIHAVDKYHTDPTGKFVWDEQRADEFYGKNFLEFSESCRRGNAVVVCDCINVEHKEFQKYIDIARQFGYITSTVVMDQPDPEVASTRNKHFVTIEQIKDMYNRWEK
jgi:predicted kinase